MLSFLYLFQKLHMHLQALCFIVEKAIHNSTHCCYLLRCLTSCYHQYMGMDFIIMMLSRGSLSTGNTLYLTIRQVHCFSLSQLEKKLLSWKFLYFHFCIYIKLYFWEIPIRNSHGSKMIPGAALVVQWLRLHVSTLGVQARSLVGDHNTTTRKNFFKWYKHLTSW